MGISYDTWGRSWGSAWLSSWGVLPPIIGLPALSDLGAYRPGLFVRGRYLPGIFNAGIATREVEPQQ